MKKTLFIIAACALAAVSCQKEMAIDNEINSEGILTVTADIAQFGADTKTSINGAAATIKPLWSTGDEIKLFDTVGNSAVYVLKSGEEGKSSASFELKGGETALSGEFACAYYPAGNATAYTDGTGITANIPSQQAYVAASGENAGTFANGSFPMVGTGTLNTEGKNLNLTFKNVFGLVQLNFTGTETIKQIELVSSHELSGAATIATDGTCTFTNGYNFVDLTTTAETQPTLDGTAKAFYIAVPAGATVSKIYVTTTSTSTRPLFKAKDITVSRSRIASLKSSTLSGAGFAEVAAYQEATDQLPVVVAGSVWAPVSCGYDATDYKYGKLYQWGRKNGCGYSATWTNLASETVAAETVIQSTTSGPISAATENASCFYINGTKPKDWLSPQNNYRWNSETGDNDPGKLTQVTPIKTGYDPCPTGWRVPTYYELNALSVTKMSTAFDTGDGTIKGYHFGTAASNIFLPAVGTRYYENGVAGGRGVSGNYWSSSVNSEGDTARLLCLHYKFGAYVGSGSRATGAPVRCVQQ